MNTLYKLLLFVFFIGSFHICSAQVTKSFSYQGVVLDDAGKPIANESVTVSVSISGTNFNQTSSATTSDLGAFAVELVFTDDIDFSQDIDYFISSTVSTSQGTVSASAPLSFVPMSIYAAEAGSIAGIDEIDGSTTNELQTISIDGNVITLSNGGSINLPTSGDGTSDDEIQELTASRNGNDVTVGLSLTSQTISINVADGDADSSNELQQLSIDGNSLVLSANGGSISLSTLADGTEDADADPNNEIQELSIDGNTLTLSNGGGAVNLPTSGGGGSADDDPNNEIQTLSKVGSDIFLSPGGGTVTDDVNDADADPINELQDLQVTSQNGSSVTMQLTNSITPVTFDVSDNDSDPNNELQDLLVTSQNGSTVTMQLSSSMAQATFDVSDGDSDPNNELQNIAFDGTTLSLFNPNGMLQDTADFSNIGSSAGSLWTDISTSFADVIDWNGLTITEGDNGCCYDIFGSTSLDLISNFTIEMKPNGLTTAAFYGSTTEINTDLYALSDLIVSDNLSVGSTATTAYKVNVNHGTSFGLNLNNNGSNWELWSSTSGLRLYANGGGSFVGSFNPTTGVYTSVSDIALKTNISNSKPVLKSILQLPVKDYFYEGDNTKITGFIAQDVQRYFPSFVVNNPGRNGDEDILSVDYAGMSSIAIKAIQEQQEIIDEQQAEIDFLKSELADIKAMIKTLSK